jgi:hypothetical protein
MDRPAKALKLAVIAVVAAALAACAGRDIESDMGMPDAPDWVNEGTRAVADDDGRLFHGVGSAPPMDNRSLQRATADTRARSDLAAVLGTFMDRVVQDYSATAGDSEGAAREQSVRREIEATTRVNVSGARIIARWRDPDSGRIYSLAEIDLDHVEQTMTAVETMSPGLREHICKRGANVFDRISDKEAATE